ncbi:MAG: apolipoprotein N-acyltransferase [Chitinivibrionia bacterium]|nr:apolipoprotein N-acyltransferase [Chitinivibrionia bacterium]
MRFTRHTLFPPVSTMWPAVLSGVMLGAAFPPYGVAALAYIALVPLVVSLLRRHYTRSESFRAGFLFGFTFFLLLLWWVKNLLPWADVTIPWLMTPALILAVLYLSLYPALFCLLLNALGGGRLKAALLLGPALWTLLEIVRSRGELGFAWGAVGYSQSDYPGLIQLAEYAGVYGVGFVVLVVNFSFGAVLLSRGLVRRAAYGACGLLIVAATWKTGGLLMERARETDSSPLLTVGVIQPDIDLRIKWDPAFTDSIFGLIERQCLEASSRKPDIYIFPETAAPSYIKYEPPYRRRLSHLAVELGKPILIGFLDARRDPKSGEMNIYNAAGLFSDYGALVAQYDKNHLLPFGEALPLSWKFPILKKINFGQGNFQPGTSLEPIRFGTWSFGTIICFESIFPEISREYVRKGAGFLVNITNDGWFGDTPGPVQHAQMCIMRAVENRRYLVRSANSGISMIVDPAGTVVQSIGLFREGAIVDTIRILSKRTFYSRYGDLAVLIPSAFFILLGIRAGRRGSVRGRPAWSM